jgi:CheY-like chemotaxis protein
MQHNRKAADAGFDHHVTKPIDLDTLQPLYAQCGGVDP